jgi:hypothetical protein
MDLSKLPRLSKTPTPPAEGQAPATTSPTLPADTAVFPCPYCRANVRVGAKFCDSCGAAISKRAARGGAAPEAFIGIVIGLLVLLFAPMTLKYASFKVFHTTPPFVDPETNARVEYVTLTDGSRIPYPQYYEFWSDLAVTSFGIALIVEGIVLLLSRSPVAIVIALAVTVSASLANLIYFVATYSSHGLALLSAIAVVIGIYMAWFQWRLLQAARGIA